MRNAAPTCHWQRLSLTPVPQPAGPKREATAHALAGAFLELLLWWIEGRTTLTAADVATTFERFGAAATRA